MLALILLDWERVGRQLGFFLLFIVATGRLRKLMVSIPERDRWFAMLVWLVICGFAADWAGLHYMVGAFLAGAAMNADWFDQEKLDFLRHNMLLVLMSVYFLSMGLRTNWALGGAAVFVAAAALLAASVSGKLVGVRIAGRVLGWSREEAWYRLAGGRAHPQGQISMSILPRHLDRGNVPLRFAAAQEIPTLGSRTFQVFQLCDYF